VSKKLPCEICGELTPEDGTEWYVLTCNDDVENTFHFCDRPHFLHWALDEAKP